MGKGYKPPKNAPTGPSGAQAAPGQAQPAPSNAQLVAMMDAEKRLSGAGALRTAEEIGDSGVLDTFRALESVDVPASERDRTLGDDAILVKQGLSKLTPEQIAAMKEEAYKHPEVAQDLPGAIEKKHYGSDLHRQYGKIIEELTGGVISCEEAMAMNPCGGLPGPGAKEIPLARKIEPILRHAMRHDANGFLLTRFGVGPGYGSKTSVLGKESSNPLAGQILGIVREMVSPTDMPKGDEATKPERFA